jgi:hypothetical protein
LPPNGFQKPFRCLATLAKTGSTSRLLNLAAIERAGGDSLLRTPALRRVLILKHRLSREDGEVAEALRWRGTATKVILPFDPSDLSLGGSALFVGQPGWIEMLVELAGATADASDLAHDQSVLETLDELPALDPFVVREHLRLKGLPVGQDCLALRASERERMQRFVAGELMALTALVNTDVARTQADAAVLARLLLSASAELRLGALGKSLGLEGLAYAGGLYAWKGFLYYKWVLADLTAPLQVVLADLSRLRVIGRVSPDTAVLIGGARARVHESVLDHCLEAHKLLGRYDAAFVGLTMDGDYRGFREFLQASPTQFLELGERLGVLSHIASFWRFRFPADAPPEAQAEEALELLQEFEANLTLTSRRASD